jgi:hypothetical protein
VLGALCLFGFLACEDEPEDSKAQSAAGSSDAAVDDASLNKSKSDHKSADAGAANDSSGNHKYVLASVVFGANDEQTSYLNVVDSLEKQELDYGKAIERPGWADLWVHEGRVFVSSREEKTITKYSVSDAGELVEEGVLNFSSYAVDVAFWSSTFVAKDKAYMIENVDDYVIWNPETMEITGVFDLPELPEHEGLIQRAGTLDRANVIRDGLLYTPMYWSDEDYFRFSPDSRIVVIDIGRDEVLRTVEAPCAGLDIGSIDDKGDIYFSTWTSGVFEPLLGESTGNCVAKIENGAQDATTAFTFKAVAEGREGAAVRSFRDGKLFMSIFHDERVDFDAPDADPAMLLGEKNWRTWVYDTEKKSAEQVAGLDWNSGATYVVPIDDAHYVLVPGSDYASTTVVSVDKNLKTSERFELRGWGTRLFQVR